jgi:hypothetical protein
MVKVMFTKVRGIIESCLLMAILNVEGRWLVHESEA